MKSSDIVIWLALIILVLVLVAATNPSGQGAEDLANIARLLFGR
jgi:hypothetical protein